MNVNYYRRSRRLFKEAGRELAKRFGVRALTNNGYVDVQAPPWHEDVWEITVKVCEGMSLRFRAGGFVEDERAYSGRSCDRDAWRQAVAMAEETLYDLAAAGKVKSPVSLPLQPLSNDSDFS